MTKKTEPVKVSVNLPRNLYELIERQRGLIPRSVFIVRLLEESLGRKRKKG